jgi:hypothetical protein
MADLRGFDANEVDPVIDYAPIPAGNYLAVITESEMKPTKSGTGSYLQLTFEIIDGPYKGRRLWSRLNLDNPNTVAVQIAKAELASICRAVGVLTPNDSIELHDIPLVVHVRCRKRPDTGELTNDIRGYSARDIEEESPAKPTKPTTPPWKR